MLKKFKKESEIVKCSQKFKFALIWKIKLKLTDIQNKHIHIFYYLHFLMITLIK